MLSSVRTANAKVQASFRFIKVIVKVLSELAKFSFILKALELSISFYHHRNSAALLRDGTDIPTDILAVSNGFLLKGNHKRDTDFWLSELRYRLLKLRKLYSFITLSVATIDVVYYRSVVENHGFLRENVIQRGVTAYNK